MKDLQYCCNIVDNRNVIGMQEIKLMYFNFKKSCLAAMKFCKQKRETTDF